MREQPNQKSNLPIITSAENYTKKQKKQQKKNGQMGPQDI